MKKKSERQKNNFTVWIVASVILFGYFLIVLLSYSKSMEKEANNTVCEQLSFHGETLSLHFQSEVDQISQSALTTAALMAQEEEVLGKSSQDQFKKAVESAKAHYGYICDIEGNAIDITGKKLNVWEDPSYSKAMTGSHVISDVTPKEDGTSEIYIYSPIKKGESVNGAVCMIYSTEQFKEIPKVSEHDGLTIYGLLSLDGKLSSLIGMKAPEEGSNLYNLLSKDVCVENEIALRKLKQNLENSKDGQDLAVINGQDRFLNYCQIGSTGLYVIEIYSKDYYNRLVTKEFRPTKDVIFKLTIALFLFFAVVLLISVLNRTLYDKQNQELVSKAETDLLTGLLNKMATQKHIQEYLEGDGKNHMSMLFVVDIDNFKKINDTMGHAFGDQVLSSLGVRLRNEFRVSDIVGRIGGDEFIVFLKDIKDDSIRRKEAKKLLNFFQNFQTGEYVKYSTTASIGVAMFPQDGYDFEELYKAADKGVYRAKQRGKNQLSFYNEEDDKTFLES